MTNNGSGSNTEKAIKGLSSQTIVTIALGVIEIVSFSIMSRLLTKEDFGYYAAISAIVVVFASFSETGIGSAVIQRKDLSKRYVNNAFTISLVFGAFLTSILFLSSNFLAGAVIDETMSFPLKLMSVTLLMNCLTSVNISIMYRRLLFLKVGLIQLVSLVITMSISIYLAVKGYGYYAIIVKAVLSSVLTFTLSLYYAGIKYSLTIDYTTFKQIFRFSGWLMASVVFRNISQQADRLLIGKLLSISLLGSYNRPKDFINQITGKINSIFDTVLFPVLAGIQDDKEKLRNSFKKSFYLLNISAILLSLAFVVNNQLIIRVFFGEEWLNLGTLMAILSLSVVFSADGRLADCYLRSLAMTKQQFYFRICEALINIFGIIVGYKFGLIGVAVAFFITNSIMRLIKILYVGNKIDIPIGTTIATLVCSWRFTLVLCPILVLGYYLLPNSWMGNVLLLLFFLIATSCVFLFFPRVVGLDYEKWIYKSLNMRIGILLNNNKKGNNNHAL